MLAADWDSLWISQNFSFFLLPSSLCLPLSCSLSKALLCSMRIAVGWSYLLVCLRLAGKANAFPDMQRQYLCVVVWPEEQDYVTIQGWVLFKFFTFSLCVLHRLFSCMLLSSEMKTACVSVCVSCVSSGRKIGRRKSLAILVYHKLNKSHHQ